MPARSVALRSPLTAYGLDNVPDHLKRAVVTVGNFDGLHRGHRHVIEACFAEARRLGAPAVVMTFDPHPRTFFRPESPVFILTPLASKQRLFAALGVDGLIRVRFDREFAQVTAESFVDDILVGRLNAKGIVVGNNFHFGRGRSGTPEMLVAAGERHRFSVTLVDTVLSDSDTPVSSSAIRHQLAAGDITGANRLLGYRWFVTGTVMRGERRGRELGFPTANLELRDDCQLRHGVYAVEIELGGKIFGGVASYGRRPTFDNGAPLLEVFVFDFDGDLYGTLVTVTFIAWIRAEERFPSADALVTAMNNDAGAARALLAEAGAGSRIDKALATIG